MNKDTLFNNIMDVVSKQVRESLNEIGEEHTSTETITYRIFCSGINKQTMEALHSKLSSFNDYGNGAIAILCNSHEEVNKTVALLINMGALDGDSFVLHSPTISITTINKNSINDSVNEDESINEDKNSRNIAWQYIESNKIKAPRQKAKLDIILKINNGEIERTPESIKSEMDATGLWDDRTEKQIMMDVDLIMRKTEPVEELSGDFETDYIYSPYAESPSDVISPINAAKNHVKWLVKHGLDVSVEESRYVFKIFIHYQNSDQFKYLVRWLAWHMGETDTVGSPVSTEDQQYFEDIIKSGKFTTY